MHQFKIPYDPNYFINVVCFYKKLQVEVLGGVGEKDKIILKFIWKNKCLKITMITFLK